MDDVTVRALDADEGFTLKVHESQERFLGSEFLDDPMEAVRRATESEKWFGIRADGKVVGLVMLDTEKDEVMVRKFVIDESCQGKGYGTRAGRELVRLAAQQFPDRTLVATVNCQNSASLKLFGQKLNFKESGLYHGGPAGPQVIFQLKL